MLTVSRLQPLGSPPAFERANPISGSHWNAGFRLDSGASRGDPVRPAFRPSDTIIVCAATVRPRPQAVIHRRDREDRLGVRSGHSMTEVQMGRFDPKQRFQPEQQSAAVDGKAAKPAVIGFCQSPPLRFERQLNTIRPRLAGLRPAAQPPSIPGSRLRAVSP
jgi:hypothetical protein